LGGEVLVRGEEPTVGEAGAWHTAAEELMYVAAVGGSAPKWHANASVGAKLMPVSISRVCAFRPATGGHTRSSSAGRVAS
jgi:hypothetical protein